MTGLELRVDELLREHDTAEPGSYQLGTPEVPETDALRRLVGMGTDAVPHLIARLGEEQPARRVACAVLALNRIGDQRAITPLAEVLARYEARHPKNVWDYAVIGQCRLALERLQGTAL
jgi:hypothetical protein